MKTENLLIHLGTLALLEVAIISAVGGQTSNSERKPNFAASIAEVSPGSHMGGPLFMRVKAAFAAANLGNGAGFSNFIARNAELELAPSSTATKQEWKPFNAAKIQSATKSCVGPYAVDEDKSWVQMSWVCRVDKDAPLSNIMTFHDSPELALTIWFEGDLITRINAVEPMPFPGSRLLAMDAYDVMKRQR